VLLERGQTVSGSDRELTPLAARLQAAGATVYVGHDADHVKGADAVIRSSAVTKDNVEVTAALGAGIPVLTRREYLAELLDGYRTIAVAGSHGKTTTTAMLAWLLTKLGQAPGFIAGGDVNNLGTNARHGESDLFVIEADEYDYMFLGLSPNLAVVTNVEHDHPDCFPTEESFHQAFRDFADRLESGGTLIVCADDVGAAKLRDYARAAGKDVKTYGFTNGPNYSARGLQSQKGSGYSFDAYKNGDHLAAVSLQIPGAHNVLNALAALAVADHLHLFIEEAAAALEEFSGAGRRFQVLGEEQGVVVVDDYGHHPTEIRATLAAARARYPQRRIWAVWQPHTFSRTTQLLSEYGSAFADADVMIMTPVYAARESRPPGFSQEHILDAIEHDSKRFVTGLDEATEILASEVESGDLVLVLSAGDADRVGAGLMRALKEKAHSHA
jgi:UDP-N-acetylmuramate--alanine ligase